MLTSWGCSNKILVDVTVLHNKLLNLGNPSTSTNKNNFINLVFLQSSILHGLLDRSHGLSKQIVVQLFKTSSGEWLREIQPIIERFNFHADLVLATQCPLSPLAFSSQLSKSPVVLADILSMLLLNQLDEVVHDSMIKVLT
ncbi:Glutamate dehydrogenase, NAD-specific [Dillenia turbinata]|uniref:Glutamate dehydrogenase, NAD-specific n=1 Tax=Dillenia turbinata TaxID=194707 RepID=A0AAN8VYM6_9MAGN